MRTRPLYNYDSCRHDTFGARYYAPSLGRFMTPDWSATPEAIPYANLSNPQSLNLYSYVENNPVSDTDPGGHWCLFGKLGTTCSSGPKLQPKEGGGDLTDPTGRDDLSKTMKATGAEEAAGVGKAETFAKAHPLITSLALQIGLAATTDGAGDAAEGAEASSEAIGATEHGAERLAERGVSSEAADEAVTTAKASGNYTTQIGKYGTSQTVYKGSNGVAVVIENEGRNAGKIITAYKTDGGGE